MKILSIDTTSNICGVSILDDTNLIYKLDINTGRTHSENLMPLIKDVLEKTNLTLQDINLIVCDKGPGSFTGIRIGVATAKAFHDSLGIPCVGVNSLETLAYNVEFDGFIASILDCKNNNCYFALYKLENNTYTEIISPTAETIDNALLQIQTVVNKNSDTKISFVGDGSISFNEKIKSLFTFANLSDEKQNNLDSYKLGLAGLNHFIAGNIDDVLPLYLKKPQVQRLRIENMKLSDLDSISDVLNSEFDDFWNYNILKEELQSSNSKYIVAKEDADIVGFAGIKITPDGADVMNIVTKKNSRNHGIGALMLNELITISKKLNVATITLEVNEENSVAIHLYEKFGFKKIGIRKNYYNNKNAIIMNK